MTDFPVPNTCSFAISNVFCWICFRADMLNKLGGDITVVHLPEAGLHGNTHFPMSDLNNREVAELMYEWLCAKVLD